MPIEVFKELVLAAPQPSLTNYPVTTILVHAHGDIMATTPIFSTIPRTHVNAPYEGGTYGPGDVIGCGIDFEKGTIFYTHNQKKYRRFS